MEMTVTIILMAIVTILPRVLPVFAYDKIRFSPLLSKWLKSIPYAVLGALIIPGVLYVEPNQPLVGALGAVVAGLLAAKGFNVMYVIFGAILTTFVGKLLI